MRRPTPPRERRGGTCPPARPGGSFLGYAENQNPRDASRGESDIPRVLALSRRPSPVARRPSPVARRPSPLA